MESRACIFALILPGLVGVCLQGGVCPKGDTVGPGAAAQGEGMLDIDTFGIGSLVGYGCCQAACLILDGCLVAGCMRVGAARESIAFAGCLIVAVVFAGIVYGVVGSRAILTGRDVAGAIVGQAG